MRSGFEQALICAALLDFHKSTFLLQNQPLLSALSKWFDSRSGLQRLRTTLSPSRLRRYGQLLQQVKERSYPLFAVGAGSARCRSFATVMWVAYPNRAAAATTATVATVAVATLSTLLVQLADASS